MTILLRSDAVEVHVTPDRGADITRLIHSATGINVFAEAPTANVTNSHSAWSDSMTHWLNGYPGGWQMLLPNAGPEREWEGVRQGFHGEASLASWDILEYATDHCELKTSLLTSPLNLHRSISVVGTRLTVTDRITNASLRPVQFRLSQHPAFGHRFLDDSSYLATNAGLFIADAHNPGTLAPPNSTGAPTDIFSPGPLPNTISLPGPHSGESLFGALTEFSTLEDEEPAASVTFVSPNTRLSAEVSWNPTTFPYTWFWIEANAMTTWPWFQRLYSIAIEPSNILPGSGQGPAGYLRGGPGAAVDAGETLTSEVSITLSHHVGPSQREE